MSNAISFTANLLSGDGSALTSLNNGYLGSVFDTDTIWYERGNDTNDSGDYYILEINAATSSSDLTLETFDLNFSWDNTAFEIVDTSDLEINDNFQYFNQVELDDNSGTARITAGSSTLGSGGEGVTNDGGQTFRILLQADNNVINGYDAWADGSQGLINEAGETVEFGVSVNSFDSVLTSGSGSSFATQGATGNATFTYDVKEKVSNLKFLDGNIEMDTDRTTGTSDSTKLIRQGDTVLNEGGSAIYLTNWSVDNSQADSTALEYSVGSYQSGISVAIADTSTDTYDFSSYSSYKVNQYLAKDESVGIDLVMKVSTSVAAGTIIDTANFYVAAGDIQNGDYEYKNFMSDKSLVTYASDLNLDGRVSMVDLAYLNSGAGDNDYARDVDVNFDGQISIDDLAAMDDQFGSSMHTSAVTDMGADYLGFEFVGNNGSIFLYEGDSDVDMGQADDAFIDQNILETSGDSDYLDGTALLTDSFSGTFDDNTFNDNIGIAGAA